MTIFGSFQNVIHKKIPSDGDQTRFAGLFPILCDDFPIPSGYLT